MTTSRNYGMLQSTAMVPSTIAATLLIIV